MTIERFTEIMKLLDLQIGEPISLVYSVPLGDKEVSGNFAGIDHNYVKRIKWEADGRLKSVCHRKVITIERVAEAV